VTTINVVVNPPAQVNVSAQAAVGAQVSTSQLQYSATVQTSGLQGPQGAQGIQGTAGPGLQIIDTLNSVSELPPTGAQGDGYIINGDLYVWGQRDIRYVGSTAASGNTASIPSGHRAGDLMIALLYRDSGANVTPSTPSGWTSRVSIGNRARVVSRIAQSSSEPAISEAISNAIVVNCYRGVDNVNPIGNQNASVETVGNAGNIQYPAVSESQSGSWFVALAGHNSIDTALQTAPPGMVNKSSAVDAFCHVVSHDTNQIATAFAFANVAIGGTTSARATYVGELKRAPTGWYNAGLIVKQPPTGVLLLENGQPGL
jgi:hypothetical protein